MKRRGGFGGGGHGAAGGASSGRGGDGGRDGEGKLRIHLKRSCTDRKLVQGETDLGLTTDGEDNGARSEKEFAARSFFFFFIREVCVFFAREGKRRTLSATFSWWMCADAMRVTQPPSP